MMAKPNFHWRTVAPMQAATSAHRRRSDQTWEPTAVFDLHPPAWSLERLLALRSNQAMRVVLGKRHAGFDDNWALLMIALPRPNPAENECPVNLSSKVWSPTYLNCQATDPKIPPPALATQAMSNSMTPVREMLVLLIKGLLESRPEMRR